METQEEQIYGLCPLMTVNDAVLFIEQTRFQGTSYDIRKTTVEKRTPSFELFLLANTLSANGTHGIPLEYHRTLKSYRVSLCVGYFDK